MASTTPHTVIIGAGIGGLTAAALLLHAGHRVTVLEAQTYPGGSAGTFFHKGYQFDAGATLAGGFSNQEPHARLAEILSLSWPVQPLELAWVVHLPDMQVHQWRSAQRWREERLKLFPGSEPFWNKQEMLADIAWQISTRHFPWPPESFRDSFSLLRALELRTLRSLPYLFSTVADLYPPVLPAGLKTFINAQLLISAQTDARKASALYGSAALDLPRRGVHLVTGGIGSLARTLARWIEENGGTLLYRQKVDHILTKKNRAAVIHTQKGLEISADQFIANITPWALKKLLGKDAPPSLNHEMQKKPPTWGAFTLYLGIQADHLPPGIGSHHQIIVNPDLPLGEGNSVFLSLTHEDDTTRAPRGMRAATLSTHTQVMPWWDLLKSDPDAYAQRKSDYTERVLNAAELAVPGIRDAARLCLPGTPVTFEFYTRRPLGMVGGQPQTSLFKARGPQTPLRNLWLVGDSIFPGQSTAGVTLGAFRTATAVLQSENRPIPWLTSENQARNINNSDRYDVQ